jgi:hypothetical protein
MKFYQKKIPYQEISKNLNIIMYFCKSCDHYFDTVETKAMILKCGHTFC